MPHDLIRKKKTVSCGARAAGPVSKDASGAGDGDRPPQQRWCRNGGVRGFLSGRGAPVVRSSAYRVEPDAARYRTLSRTGKATQKKNRSRNPVTETLLPRASPGPHLCWWTSACWVPHGNENLPGAIHTLRNPELGLPAGVRPAPAERPRLDPWPFPDSKLGRRPIAEFRTPRPYPKKNH